MKVEEISGLRARCSAFGQDRWIDLTLMANEIPRIGEYLIVHLGFAQRMVPEIEAQKSYELFEQLRDILESRDNAHPVGSGK